MTAHTKQPASCVCPPQHIYTAFPKLKKQMWLRANVMVAGFSAVSELVVRASSSTVNGLSAHLHFAHVGSFYLCVFYDLDTKKWLLNHTELKLKKKMSRGQKTLECCLPHFFVLWTCESVFGLYRFQPTMWTKETWPRDQFHRPMSVTYVFNFQSDFSPYIWSILNTGGMYNISISWTRPANKRIRQYQQAKIQSHDGSTRHSDDEETHNNHPENSWAHVTSLPLLRDRMQM